MIGKQFLTPKYGLTICAVTATITQPQTSTAFVERHGCNSTKWCMLLSKDAWEMNCTPWPCRPLHRGRLEHRSGQKRKSYE